jgi:hypothetical protein
MVEKMVAMLDVILVVWMVVHSVEKSVVYSAAM